MSQQAYIVSKINMKISFRGQSLTEILVALALGVSFINVGILAMTTTNFLARINKANSYALSLLKSQSSILETISENGWHSIADLTIGKHYKLAKQNNSWIVQPGEEKVFDEKPPVAQWNMDEGSGTITYDSQSSNNGTLVNSPTWQAKTNCISGNCLGFNGTTNYVDLGTPSSLMAVTYPYTITAWAKLTALAQNAIIMSFAPTDTASQLAFGVYNTGNQILIGNAAYTYGLSGISSYLKVNTWQYWTIVFADPTHISFYLDGQNKTITNIAQYYSPINNNIGARQNGGDKWFNGSIDDVRLYNRALSPDEIANQYKDGYTKYFYVNNVSRDIASDPTASTHNLETAYNANHDDPNTKKIINITRYLQGPSGRVNSEEQYLARVNNISSLIQTDWSGASGIDGPEIDFGNNYSSANNLTLSEAGQISLNSTASNGSLISSIADTQSVGGAGYFNILWQGDTLCTGCSVKFQIAASNSQNGPWTYYGPTSTSDYYIPNSPNVAVPITYAGQYSALSSSIQNKRYIRYQITLVPASSQSPVVKDVIINYAP